MEEIKEKFKDFVRWVISNIAWTIIQFIAGVVVALLPSTRTSLIQWLVVRGIKLTSIEAGVVLFFLVMGALTVLHLLGKFVRWSWRKFRPTQSKLELKFDRNHDSSVMTGHDETGNVTGTLFRISLTNMSTRESIEDIHVNLEEINPNPPLAILPAELGFMHNRAKRLVSGERLFVDFIGVVPTKNNAGDPMRVLHFGYEVNGIENRQSAIIEKWRSYKFTVEARGSGTSPTRKTFEFVVNKRSQKKPFELRELSDGQTKNNKAK